MSAITTKCTLGSTNVVVLQRTAVMECILENFPEELIMTPQWVLWKMEMRGGRMSKVPYQPNGMRAESTTSATWSDCQSVMLAYTSNPSFSGIGFVFTKDDPYVGIDLDKCRDPVTGVVEPWASTIVDDIDTYAELSPSGKGFHLIGKGTLPAKGRRKDQVEMYDSGRYFTVTGDHYGQASVQVEDIQTSLIALHASIFGNSKPQPQTTKPSASNEPAMAVSLAVQVPVVDDQVVIDGILASGDAATFRQFQSGSWAALGYPSQSEADLAYAGMLARHAGPQAEQIDRIFRCSGMMRDKWDEQRGVNTYGEMTIAKVLEATADDSPMAQFMVQMNQRFALLAIGNKLKILDESGGDANIKFLSKPDFELLCANLPTPIAKQAAATVWQKSPQRRYFNSLVFAPERDIAGAYNFWRGFSVSPLSGGCSLFWQFVLVAICSGSVVLYAYIRCYFAHMIQRPWELPEVAIVLRSGQGYGKNTFVEAMGSLVSHHFRQVNSMDQITGRFNGHLQNLLLLHANEAIWGGSKADKGKLKAMISDPKMPVEMKGLDIVDMDNYLRLVVSSNEDWPVPVDLDDRRFFILDVSSVYKQDHVFFAALHAELDNGGREALMHDLMVEDISQFSPRNKPATPFGADIKLRSADSPTRWLHDFLNDNSWMVDGKVFDQSGKPVEVLKSKLYVDYEDWSRSSPDRYPAARDQFFKVIRKLLDKSMVDSRPAATTGQARERMFILTSIDDCRTAFEHSTGTTGFMSWEPV